ncbi:MAG TPA: hypothetical protein VFQ35_10100 [Polyangiaceae bacterium]|nr:hypothetical protein [Polyangiaceae bacterium]
MSRIRAALWAAIALSVAACRGSTTTDPDEAAGSGGAAIAGNGGNASGNGAGTTGGIAGSSATGGGGTAASTSAGRSGAQTGGMSAGSGGVGAGRSGAGAGGTTIVGVAGAAGAALAGAAGANSAGHCTTAKDCDPGTLPGSLLYFCRTPFDPPLPEFVGCGTKEWCGECGCAAMPDASATCTSDTQCPNERPRCVSVGHSPGITLSECSECQANSDCPAEHPFCVSPGPGSARHCMDCVYTSDCSRGTCAQNRCVECTPATDCVDPVLKCSDRTGRCDKIPCSLDGDCPSGSKCNAGACERTHCSLDPDCGPGYCINGACYGSPGSCATQRVLY